MLSFTKKNPVIHCLNYENKLLQELLDHRKMFIENYEKYHGDIFDVTNRTYDLYNSYYKNSHRNDLISQKTMVKSFLLYALHTEHRLLINMRGKEMENYFEKNIKHYIHITEEHINKNKEILAYEPDKILGTTESVDDMFIKSLDRCKNSMSQLTDVLCNWTGNDNDLSFIQSFAIKVIYEINFYECLSD